MKSINKKWFGRSLAPSVVLVSIMASMMTLVSCRPNLDSSSRVKFRPADPNARNVALIVGSPNDLEGVAKDVQEVSKLIRDSQLGYEVSVIPVASASQIMAKAKELGATLSENSTVLFYFSGHGSEQGYLFAQGLQQFKLSSVAKSFGSGLGQGKFKRFIAVMDSCFSGQNVNGDQAMFLNQSKPLDIAEILSASVGHMASDLKPKADPNLPFEQALVLSAAQRNQTSLDMGPSIGGAFTYALRKVLKKDLSSPGNVTLGQVLNEAKKETIRQSGGGHTPAWKAMPESMLSEPLTPSKPDESAVFVALGETQSPFIFASLPSQLSSGSVELCKGDVVACSTSNAQRVLSMVQANDLNITGRSVFRGEKGYTVNDGDVLTIVIKAAGGNAVAAQAVKITKK
jgi:hypothetical protein